MFNQQFCNIHGEPYIYFDQQTEKGLCRFCAQKKIDNVVSIEQMEQQHQQKINKAVNEISNTIELLQSINDQLHKFKQYIQMSTEKVIQILYEQINKMKEQIEKYVNHFNFGTKNMQSFQSEYSNQQQFNHQLKNQLYKLLSDIQSRLSLENIIKQVSLIAQEPQSQIQEKKQRIYIQEIIQQNWFRNLEFKQVYQSQIQNMDYCRAFAINKDQNILLVGCGKQINVYEFKNGLILNQVQVLSNHQHDVTCICFMEKSRQFVSASKDKSIKIWCQGNNLNWKQIESIPLHNDWINALIINQKENLIISASDDKTLKFLSLVDQKWVCSQSIDLQNENSSIRLNQITSISLNLQQDKLIACGNDPQILILEFNAAQWSIVQTINIKEYGFRLCFIDNNQFVFQPFRKDVLEIYTYNKQKKTFKQEGVIYINQCKNCEIYFPCQYISQKNLIMVKHGKFLNFFQIIDNREIKFESTIEFADNIFYGTLSQNGQYLITWDSGLKQISVRQINYIQ